MFGLGTTELIVIAVIVLILFGAKRLPEIGKGLGGALREFKNVKKDLMKEDIADKEPKELKSEEEKTTPALENKIAEKVMEQVPGAKKAMDAKKKVDKVKDILRS